MKVDAIDIIGTGESSLYYDWGTKNFKWSVASAFKKYGYKVDLYFCMHDGETVEHDKILQKDYPIKEITELYKSSYFSCSISYMIAYAIYTGIKKLNIVGVDMSIGSEYQFERPSVLYWIGRAEGEGVEVNTALNKNIYMYGYETSKMLKIENKLKTKESFAKIKIDNTDGNEKQQWLGRLHTLKELKNIIRT